MKKIGITLGFVSLAFSAVACGSSSNSGSNDPAPGTGGASLTDYCASICERVSSCDHTQDVQTCSSQCTNNNAASFPKMRADFVGKVESCEKSEIDCQTVIAGGALSTCVSEAQAEVSPTAAATDFCDAYKSAQEKCGLTVDKGQCLDSSKAFTDAAVADAKACTAKACTTINTCVNAAWGIAGQAVPTPGQPPAAPGSLSIGLHLAD